MRSIAKGSRIVGGLQIVIRRVIFVAMIVLPLHAYCLIEIGQSAPPNVIFILSDDQGWGDYSFLGHSAIRTPNLDQLARESLVFSRGYVPDSLCRPSLATIISGLYPHQHGIVGNDPPVPLDLRSRQGTPYTDPRYMEVREKYIGHIDRIETLPKRLTPLGYRSFQSGKWWEGNFARGGFSAGMTHGKMLEGGRHGDEGLKIGREGMEPIDRFLEGAAKEARPFFLWYAPMMPHTPHDPPARLLEHYLSKTPSPAIAKYWAMCEWFDETIGQLRGLLAKHGVDKNTIMIYVCDNGWINDPRESRYAPRSKRTPYEGGIRTPIMIHFPGKVPARIDADHLASSIDLVPTVLKLLDLPLPKSLPGIPLHESDLVERRKMIQGEIFEHDIVDMEDPQASLMYRWVIEGDWKLIRPNLKRLPDSDVELYHLKDDPSELVNVARQHKDIVDRLEAALQPWR